jgi:GTP-binding protein HflX
MSRLGGGIGTRGPGETKLEVDRRHIRSRIAYLKSCLDKIKNVRDLHKTQRQKNNVPTVCLVGYTNAGKSTLLNKLTDSHIYVQDQLFATLDPTTRQLSLPDNQKAVLTDTVGFIQRLPHQLVAAFKSTLEVVQDADLLIHVVDLSHPLYKEQSQAVYSVLKELKAGEKNILTVYNKIDLLPKGDGLLERLRHDEECVCISAATGLGIDDLLKAISERLRMQVVEATYLFPYANNNILSNLYKDCTIIE